MNALQEALDVTENMYAAALRSAWDELDELHRRQTVLVDLALQKIESVEDASILRRIKELTDQVIELAEQHRQELGKQLVQMKKGGDVQNAYMKNINR
ncbi:MAG: flagellar protein FliT [Gammaproteobacteria bacterium]